MNYYDPSSQNQEFCHQPTNNNYPYSYSYPNPQFSSSVHPYPYPNPIVQPSQHEEKEPNPPGVTPPPPTELCQNPYYQYHAHGAAAGAPTVGPHPGAVAGGPTAVHQPIVQQPLYGGFGAAQIHSAPELNPPSYPFHVNGRGRGGPPHMNAEISFHNQTLMAYGGFQVQGGGPSQLPSQYFGGRDVSGRVRGRGRGKGHLPRKQGKSDITERAPPQPPAALPPPKAVSCELCKVECNTVDILQQHMSGKKHQKKLKAFEALQNLNKKVISSQTVETPPPPPVAELKAEVVPQEVLPSQEIEVAGEKRKVEEVEPLEESAKKMKVSPVKRKLKVGRSKKLKPSKSLVKPKEVAAPLVCELCNVKCESVVVFQSHLAGKKHKSKAKVFLSQAQTPAMQAVNQNNGNASTSVGFQGI